MQLDNDDWCKWLKDELLWACLFIVGEFKEEGLRESWRAINNLRKLGYLKDDKNG